MLFPGMPGLEIKIIKIKIYLVIGRSVLICTIGQMTKHYA